MHSKHGATLLQRYLQSRGISLYAFCRDNRLDRIALSRLLKGERKRVSVDIALRVQRATGGAVPVASWASEAVS